MQTESPYFFGRFTMTTQLTSQSHLTQQGLFGFEPTLANQMTNKKSNQNDSFRLIADKLTVPSVESVIARPRLQQLLTKTLEQFGSTLVCGRAGTGKTALVADYARNCGRAVAWYTIESADSDWEIFSRYLIGSLSNFIKHLQPSNYSVFNNQDEIATMTEVLGGLLAEAAIEQPILIVLDDAHCVFDAEWFAEFFQTLLPTLSQNVQLLTLSRSLPPLPLWRMRSKQMLGVVDENLLAFTAEETAELFEKFGISAELAGKAHQYAYGRAAKLRHFLDLFSTKETNFAF